MAEVSVSLSVSIESIETFNTVGISESLPSGLNSVTVLKLNEEQQLTHRQSTNLTMDTVSLYYRAKNTKIKFYF